MNSVQDTFLSQIQESKEPVTIFLINGVKLQGILVGFDESSIVLRRNNHSQLVYKHSVSTIMPAAVVSPPKTTEI